MFMRKMFKLRKRLALIACAVLMALPFHHARAIGLKEHSVVTDNTIKLGDIFYGLPRDEDRVLGMAPRPGQDMVLNARTLLRIALSLDLAWRPASVTDQVILKRAATVIDTDVISSRVREALRENGAGGRFTVSLPQEHQEIILPHDQPATLDITRVSLDHSSGRYEVTVAAPSKDNPLQEFTINGQIQPIVLVPVLKNNIENGRVIRESDLDYVEVLERDFISGTIIDEQALVGMTPRRIAFAHRPLNKNDIVAPQVVARGDVVLMRLQEGPLQLTMQAKALENGSTGDVIRVLNTSSNVTVQAVVTGEKEVRVATAN